MPVDQSSELIVALRGYSDRRDASIAAARRGLGIGDLDARALLFIASRNGVRAGDIATQLGISSAGVTALLDRLERHGAVRRVSDPDDRRIIRVEATVDFAEPPWSALTEFDTASAEAVADVSGQHAIGYVLRVLDRITAAWDRRAAD